MNNPKGPRRDFALLGSRADELGRKLTGFFILNMKITDKSMLEDLLQKTLLRAAERIHQLRRPENLWPWLKTIARSVANDEYRKRERERKGLALYAAQTRQSTCDDKLREVNEMLEIVPKPINRRIVFERIYEGRTYRDIAHDLPISIGEDGVRKRCNDALRAIKSAIGR